MRTATFSQALLLLALRFFLGGSRYERQFFQIVLDGAGWGSPEDYAFASQHLLGQDAALASQQRAGFYAGMIADAYLSSHDYVVFDSDAAGESGLRGDVYIFADVDVVA